MKLAIKGHVTRGKEVIQLLEMLGGKSKGNLNGYNDDLYYYIATNGLIYGSDIEYEELCCKYTLFTLEEFENKFPYKVEERVTHKCNNALLETQVITNMRWDSGDECVIYYLDNYDIIKVEDILYRIDFHEDNISTIQGEGTEYENIKVAYLSINDKEYADEIEVNLGDDYEYKFEMNRLYILKKKPKYPKDYEECCDILGRIYPITDDVEWYKWELIKKFQRLIVCRDAYWKIAGEQMGLNKKWEPDWSNGEETKFCIYTTQNMISLDLFGVDNRILAFPSEEMRDAFFENFRNLIEQCKCFL